MSNDSSSSESMKENTTKAARTLRSEAGKLAGSAQGTAESIARNRAEEARGVIASHTNSVEHAVDDIASTLSEHSDTLGQYVNEFSGSLSNFNKRLKNQSLDDLASEARTLARDNPAMFMLGAVTIGVIAARFFKASTPEGVSVPSAHYGNDAADVAAASRTGNV